MMVLKPHMKMRAIFLEFHLIRCFRESAGSIDGPNLKILALRMKCMKQ